MTRLAKQLWICCFIVWIFIHYEARSQSQTWSKQFPSAAKTIGINPLNPNTVCAEDDSGKLYVSYNRGGTWSFAGQTGIVYGIRQILIHPSDTSTWFCAGEDVGGWLMKSTNHGSSWYPVIANFGLDGEGIGIDPLHPDTIIAGDFWTGDVYRSTDRGETWTRRGTAGHSLCALAVRADGGDVIYAAIGDSGKISKSTDAGATWRVVRQAVKLSEIPKVVSSPSNPLIGYATMFDPTGSFDTTSGVLKTTDGGEHWKPTALWGDPLWALAIDQTNSDIVYAGSFYGGTTTVYKSVNGGGSWSKINAGLPTGGYVWSLRTHPIDSHFLWASVTQGTFGFGGAFSYRSGALRATIRGAVLDGATGDTVRTGIAKNASSGDVVNLTISGGSYAFQYYDGDPSVSPTVHVEAYPFYLLDTALAFTLDSSTIRNIHLRKLPLALVQGTLKDSSEHPVTGGFTIKATLSYGTLNLAANADSNGHFRFDNIAAPYPQLISKYDMFVDPALPFRQLRMTPLSVDSAGLNLSLHTQPADVFLAGEDSLNYGNYFQAALDSLGLTSNAPWNTIVKGPAPYRAGRLFRKNTVIYFTGTKHTPLAHAELDSLAACLNARCNLFITGQDFVEKNDTSAFLRNGLGVRFAGNTIVAGATGTAGDLFSGMSILTIGPSGANDQTSRDSLLITSPLTKPILTYSSGRVAGVRIDSAGAGGKVVLMGFGFEAITPEQPRRSVMQRVISYFDGSIVTGVKEPAGDRLPGTLSLEQNFPNPFNPATTIRYGIPAKSFLSVAIFNLLGERVRTLLSEVQNAGSHSLRWDGLNDAGEALPSGVYLYRLTGVSAEGISRSFAATKKLLLIR